MLGLEFHHDGGRRRYQLRQGVSRLGRAPDCEVIVEGEDVSRYHAEITLDEDGLRVFGLGWRLSRSLCLVMGWPPSRSGLRT